MRTDPNRSGTRPRAAAFEFFEPVASGQTSRWAGGFGREPDGTTSLEVIAQIGGGEVSVETSSLPRTRHVSMRRMVAVDLLWHFVGVRVDGDARWIGVADHAGATLRITAANTDDFAIRRCVEWESLADAPPMPR